MERIEQEVMLTITKGNKCPKVGEIIELPDKSLFYVTEVLQSEKKCYGIFTHVKKRQIGREQL